LAVAVSAFSFDEIAKAATGLEVTDFEANRAARVELLADTVRIEERLTSLGFDMTPAPAQDITAIGDLTGTHAIRERRFRKCRFLPIVAKYDRAEWVRVIDYFLKNDPQGRYARYGVISCGERIPFTCEFVEESKKRIARQQDKIRRWINESREIYGVDIILKTFETALNPHSAHHHFNVIYIPRRGMRKDRFRKWLAWSRKRLGVHWKDCGRVENLREVIKYACKLQGPDSLSAISDDSFSSMFKLMHGRSTIEAHGSFADFRRDLEKAGQRITYLRRAGAPPVLVKMKKQRRSTNAEKHITPGDAPKRENIIIGRQLPRVCGKPVLEPVTMVLNYTPHPTTEAGVKGLETLQMHRQIARAWAAENGSGFNVHTVTASVQTSSPPEPPSGRSAAAERPAGDGGSGSATVLPPPKRRTVGQHRASHAQNAWRLDRIRSGSPPAPHERAPIPRRLRPRRPSPDLMAVLAAHAPKA
jgi:hypothetical protein